MLDLKRLPQIFSTVALIFFMLYQTERLEQTEILESILTFSIFTITFYLQKTCHVSEK